MERFISSIHETEYLDAIYEELIEVYQFDVTNAAVCYLFHRDIESNTDSELILELIRTLKNARENDNNMMGGMLILSYPSIEAYEISYFLDESFQLNARLGTDAKKYISQNSKQLSMNKINEESIIHGCLELNKYMEKQKIEPDFDDLSEANEIIFDKEENYFKDNNTYFLLSMMSCILLDSGILHE